MLLVVGGMEERQSEKNMMWADYNIIGVPL